VSRLSALMLRCSVVRIAPDGSPAPVSPVLQTTLAGAVVGGDAPTAVKQWIARVVVVLVPVMAVAALSGRRLAGGSRAVPVRSKLRRTQIAAAIGVLVLGPCALAGSPVPPDEMVR